MKQRCFIFSIIVLTLIVIGAISCDVGLGEAVDTEAPIVEILKPEADAVVRVDSDSTTPEHRTIYLSGTCSDDKGLSRIDITFKDTRIANLKYEGFVAEMAPNQKTWWCPIDPKDKGIPDGSYEVIAIATDDAGRKSSPASKTFVIDTTPPILVLERPSGFGFKDGKVDETEVDKYGSKFTLKGQIGDDNEASLIELTFYKSTDVNFENPINKEPIQVTGIQKRIETTVFEYNEEDNKKEDKTNPYKTLYGVFDKQHPDAKYFSVKMTVYDEAVLVLKDKYDGDKFTYIGADGKEHTGIKGNKRDYFFLNDDIATDILNNEEVRLSGAYQIESGRYILNNPGAKEKGSYKKAQAILEGEKDKEKEIVGNVKYATLSLNPANDPELALGGMTALTSVNDKDKEGNPVDVASAKNDLMKDSQSENVILNNSALAVTLKLGLDQSPLVKDSLGVYLLQCTYDEKTKEFSYNDKEADKNKKGRIWLIKPDEKYAFKGRGDEKDVSIYATSPDETNARNLLQKQGSYYTASIPLSTDKTKEYKVEASSTTTYKLPAIETGSAYLVCAVGYDQNGIEFENFSGGCGKWGFFFASSNSAPRLSEVKASVQGGGFADANNIYINKDSTLSFTGNVKADQKTTVYISIGDEKKLEENKVVKAGEYPTPTDTYEGSFGELKFAAKECDNELLPQDKSSTKEIFVVAKISDELIATQNFYLTYDLDAPTVEVNSVAPYVEGWQGEKSGKNILTVNGDITISTSCTDATSNIDLKTEGKKPKIEIFTCDKDGKPIDSAGKPTDKAIYTNTVESTTPKVEVKTREGAFNGIDKTYLLIKVSAYDLAGNLGEGTTVVYLDQESDKPRLTSDDLKEKYDGEDYNYCGDKYPEGANKNQFTKGSPFTVVLEDDDGLDAATVTVYKDGTMYKGEDGIKYETPTVYDSSKGKTFYSLTHTLPSKNGDYQVKIEVKDKNYNTKDGETYNKFDKSYWVRVVPEKPTISIDSGSYYGRAGGTITVTGKVSGSQPLTVYRILTLKAGYKIEAESTKITGDQPSASASDDDWNDEFPVDANAQESDKSEEHYYYVYDGNDLSESTPFNYKVDNTPPTIEITAPTNRKLTNNEYTFNGKSSDAKSGVLHVYTQVLKKGVAAPTVGVGIAQDSKHTGWQLNDSTKSWNVPYYFSVLNVGKYEYTDADGTRDTTKDKNVDNITVFEEGTYVLYAYSEDIAGNLSGVASYEFDVVLGDPVIELEALKTDDKSIPLERSGNTYVGSQFKFKYKVTDSGRSITGDATYVTPKMEVTKKDGITTTLTKGTDYTVGATDTNGYSIVTINNWQGDGTYTLSITAKDPAVPSSTVTKSIAITLDMTPPNIGFKPNWTYAENGYVKNLVTLAIKEIKDYTNDAEKAVASGVAEIDWATTAPNVTRNSTSIEWNSVSVNAPSSKQTLSDTNGSRLWIRAVDGVGNTSYNHWDYKIDTVKPTAEVKNPAIEGLYIGNNDDFTLEFIVDVSDENGSGIYKVILNFETDKTYDGKNTDGTTKYKDKKYTNKFSMEVESETEKVKSYSVIVDNEAFKNMQKSAKYLIEVTDMAGNKTTTAERTLNVDNDPPELKINNPGETDVFVYGKISINGTATDNQEVKAVRVYRNKVWSGDFDNEKDTREFTYKDKSNSNIKGDFILIKEFTGSAANVWELKKESDTEDNRIDTGELGDECDLFFIVEAEDVNANKKVEQRRVYISKDANRPVITITNVNLLRDENKMKSGNTALLSNSNEVYLNITDNEGVKYAGYKIDGEHSDWQEITNTLKIPNIKDRNVKIAFKVTDGGDVDFESNDSAVWNAPKLIDTSGHRYGYKDDDSPLTSSSFLYLGVNKANPTIEVKALDADGEIANNGYTGKVFSFKYKVTHAENDNEIMTGAANANVSSNIVKNGANVTSTTNYGTDGDEGWNIVTIDSLTTNGNYTITVTAKDPVDTTSTTTATMTVGYDTTGPAFGTVIRKWNGGSAPASDTWSKIPQLILTPATGKLTEIAPDDTSGLKTLEFVIVEKEGANYADDATGHSALENAISDDANLSWESITLNSSEKRITFTETNGSYLWLKATDNVENVTYWTDGLKYKVDTSAPSLTMKSPDEGGYIGKTSAQTFTIEASDSLSGIKKVSLTIPKEYRNSGSSDYTEEGTFITNNIYEITVYENIITSIKTVGETANYTVTAINGAGIETKIERSVKFDTTAPTVEIKNPVAGNVYGTITVNGTATDTNGVKSVSIYREISGQEDVLIKTYGEGAATDDDKDPTKINPWSLDFDTTTIADGTTITFYAIAEDAYGNKNAKTVTGANVKVKVDQDADRPVVKVSSIPLTAMSDTNYALLSNTDELYLSITDSDGVASAYYSIDKYLVADSTEWISFDDINAPKIPSGKLSDDKHTIYFKVVDKKASHNTFISNASVSNEAIKLLDNSGNKYGYKTGALTEDSRLYLGVDKNAPVVTITDTARYTKGEVKFSYTVTHEGAKPAVALKLNGEEVTSTTCTTSSIESQNSGVWTLTNTVTVTSPTDKDYTLVVEATDPINSERKVTSSQTIGYDTTGPAITLPTITWVDTNATPETGNWHGTNRLSIKSSTSGARLSSIATDAGSGLESLYWVVVDKTDGNYSESEIKANIALSWESISVNAQSQTLNLKDTGSAYLWIKAVDNLGNESYSSDNKVYKIDTTLPEVTILMPETNGDYIGTSSDYKFKIKANEDLSGITDVKLSLKGKEYFVEKVSVNLKTETEVINGNSETFYPITVPKTPDLDDLTLESPYDYTVTVTNGAGKPKTLSQTLRVDRKAPTVKINNPSAGNDIYSSVTVNGSATDENGVVKVTLYRTAKSNDEAGCEDLAGATSVNGVSKVIKLKEFTGTNVNPWTYNFNTAEYTDNTYLYFYVIAEDKYGNKNSATASGANVKVKVDQDKDRPEVKVTNVTLKRGTPEAAMSGTNYALLSNTDELYLSITDSDGVASAYYSVGSSLPTNDSDWIPFEDINAPKIPNTTSTKPNAKLKDDNQIVYFKVVDKKASHNIFISMTSVSNEAIKLLDNSGNLYGYKTGALTEDSRLYLGVNKTDPTVDLEVVSSSADYISSDKAYTKGEVKFKYKVTHAGAEPIVTLALNDAAVNTEFGGNCTKSTDGGYTVIKVNSPASGEYRFAVTVKDPVDTGKVIPPYEKIVVFDNVAPGGSPVVKWGTASVSEGVTNGYHKSNRLTLEFANIKDNEDGCGLASISYAVLTQEQINNSVSKSWNEVAINSPAVLTLEDTKSSTIYLKAVDKLGNENEPVWYSLYQIDTGKPTIDVTSPTAGAYVGVNNNLLINIDVDDEISGIDSAVADADENAAEGDKLAFDEYPVVVTFNGGQYKAKSPNKTGESYWQATVPASDLGGISANSANYTVTAMDKAGNTFTSAPRMVRFDKESPIIAVVTPSDGATVYGKITLNGSVTELVGLKETKIYRKIKTGETADITISGDQVILLDTLTGNDGFTWSKEVNTVDLYNGIDLYNGERTAPWNFYVTAIDNAGNYSEKKIPVTIDQDAARPIITITKMNFGSKMHDQDDDSRVWLINDNSISGYVTAPSNINISNFEYSLDGSSYTSLTVPDNTVIFNFTINDISITSPNKTMYFKVKYKGYDTWYTSADNTTDYALATPRLTDGSNKYAYKDSHSHCSVLKFTIDKDTPDIQNIEYNTALNKTDEAIAADGSHSRGWKTWSTDIVEVFGGPDETPLPDGALPKVYVRLKATDSNDIKQVNAVLNTSQGVEKQTINFNRDGNYYYSTQPFNMTIGNDYYNVIFTAIDKAGTKGMKSCSVFLDNTGPNVSFNTVKQSSVKGVQTLGGTTDNAIGPGDYTTKLYYAFLPVANPKWEDGVNIVTGDEPAPPAKNYEKWELYNNRDGLVTTAWNFSFNGKHAEETAAPPRTESTRYMPNLTEYIETLYRDSYASVTPTIGSGDIHNDLQAVAGEPNLYTYTTPIYIFFKAVDSRGNEQVRTEPFVFNYNPEGDRPDVSIINPKNGTSTGGTVRLFGSAYVDDPGYTIKRVIVQIDPNYNGTFNTDWWTDSNLGALNNKGNGTKYYEIKSSSDMEDDVPIIPSSIGHGIVANYSNGSWNLSINENSHLIPSGENAADLGIRVYSISTKGKVSNPDFIKVTVSNDLPIIGGHKELSLVKKEGNTIVARRSYEKGMWVTGNWYLTGSVEHSQGVESFKIGDESQSIPSPQTEYTETGTKGFEFEYNLNTGSSSTSFNKSLEVVGYVEGVEKKTSQEILIYCDNDAPEFDFNNGGWQIPYPIQNSDGYYRLAGRVIEDNSGFDRLAFYFTRTDRLGVKSIYDPMRKNTTSDKILISGLNLEDGLYFKNVSLVASSDTMTNQLTVIKTNMSTYYDNIRVGGLVKVSGAYYLVKNKQESGTNYIFTISDYVATDGLTSAKFAIAQVVDNTQSESLAKDGTVEGDDGDGMCELVRVAGGATQWAAQINSNNIPDGYVDIHVVAFDKAGNINNYTLENYRVSNNAPRLAGVRIATDLNGNGTLDNTSDYTEFVEGWSGLDASSLLNASGVSYAKDLSGVSLLNPPNDSTQLNAILNNIAKVGYYMGGNATAIREKLSLKSNDEDNPACITIRGDTWIYPTIVGGNKTLKYSYKVHRNNSDQYYYYSVADESRLSENDENNVLIPLADGISDSDVNAYVNYNKPIKFTLKDAFLTAGGRKIYDDDDIPLDKGGGADYQKAVFTIFDNTEGLTMGKDSQSVEIEFFFKLKLKDTEAPKAYIKPFYWNNARDNSLFRDKDDKALGHIELEGDLPTETFNQSSGVFDKDPKVSGKIVIEGYAEDNNRIDQLKFSFSGLENDAILDAATYNDSSNFVSEKPVPDNGSFNGNWMFDVTKNEFTANGHRVEYKLYIDTEKITNVADIDRICKIYAYDLGSPSLSGSNIGYTGANSSAPGNSQTKKDALTGYYQMDVVPYITKVTTGIADRAGDEFARSALGKYSVGVGNDKIIKSGFETVTLEGFNLDTTYRTATIGGTTVTTTLSGKAIKVGIGTTAKSGKLELSVGANASTAVPILNNKNNNPTFAADGQTITKYEYNSQANGITNNRLNDDVEFVIWDMGYFLQQTNITSPMMKMDSSGKYYISYGYRVPSMYVNINGTPRQIDYSYNKFHNTNVAYDSSGNIYAVGTNTDRISDNSAKFVFYTGYPYTGTSTSNYVNSGTGRYHLEQVYNYKTNVYDINRVPRPKLYAKGAGTSAKPAKIYIRLNFEFQL